MGTRPIPPASPTLPPNRTARPTTTPGRARTSWPAYHTTAGVASARADAVNLDIKNIKRVAPGFRYFDNYRARIIARLGRVWQTPPNGRLRDPHALALAA